jgi:hypothetical protein
MITTSGDVQALVDKSILGDGFGLMKDEYPDYYIIAGIFPAPKTYFLLLLHKETTCIHMAYRSKGCPNNTRYKLADKTYNLSALQYYPLEPREIGSFEPFYYLINDNDVLEESSYIKWEWVVRVYHKKDGTKILTSFGRLGRYFNDINSINTALRIKSIENTDRLLGKKDWWKEGKRIYISSYDIALPVGHEALPEDSVNVTDHELDEKISDYINSQ